MNYTVMRGDTLGTIAQKFLGSSAKWREIWSANPQITDPNRISPGQIIKIPGQSQAQAALVPATQQILPVIDVTPIPVKNSFISNFSPAVLVGIGVLTFLFFNMKRGSK